MSDTPLEVIEQVISSQNFVMIVIGALIWILGSYIPFIGFLFIIAGFGLTTIATVQAAMTKPVTSAFPGLLLGGLIQVIGYLVLYIPIAGILIFPFLNIPGAVLILFYGSSLALQRADIPIVKDIEDFIDSRKKKEPSKDTEEEVVDVEEETTEESDTTEQ
ncbi:MAG: hypothetical protein ACXACG_12520 [Candidatus Thorarchaeota archaeon]|jgi:hypothetical protein